MNKIHFQLPLPEQIYDFDNDHLIRKLAQINKKLTDFKKKTYKLNAIENQWVKNANKIISLINIELDERKGLQNYSHANNDVTSINQNMINIKLSFLSHQIDTKSSYQTKYQQSQKSNRKDISDEFIIKKIKPVNFPRLQLNTVETQKTDISNKESKNSGEKSVVSIGSLSKSKKRKDELRQMMNKILIRTKVEDNRISIGKSPITFHKDQKQPSKLKMELSRPVTQKIQSEEKTRLILQSQPKPHQKLLQRIKKKQSIIKSMKMHKQEHHQLFKNQDLVDYIKKQQGEKIKMINKKRSLSTQQINSIKNNLDFQQFSNNQIPNNMNPCNNKEVKQQIINHTINEQEIEESMGHINNSNSLHSITSNNAILKIQDIIQQEKKQRKNKNIQISKDQNQIKQQIIEEKQDNQNNNKEKSNEKVTYKKLKSRKIIVGKANSNKDKDDSQKSQKKSTKITPIVVQNQVIIQNHINQSNKSDIPLNIPNYIQIVPSFAHLFTYTYLQQLNFQTIKQIMKQFQSNFKLYRNIKLNQLSKAQNPKLSNYLNDSKELFIFAQTTFLDLQTLINRFQILKTNIDKNNNQQINLSNIRFFKVLLNQKQFQNQERMIRSAFLRTQNWLELPHGANLKNGWNLLWTLYKNNIDFTKLLIFQRVNFFPRIDSKYYKQDALQLVYHKFNKLFKNDNIYIPETYFLPNDLKKLISRCNNNFSKQSQLWVVKQKYKQIKIVSDLSELEVNNQTNLIIQKFYNNTLHIQGFKFNMKIYALITSIHPLEAFLYKQGVVSLNSIGQSLQQQPNLKNQNKKLKKTFMNAKISLKYLQQKLEAEGIQWIQIWNQIQSIVFKSLLIFSSNLYRCPNSFEILQFNILVNNDKKCSLISLNSDVNLKTNCVVEQIIKQSLIDDTIQLINPLNFNREECIKIFNQQIKKKGQPQINKNILNEKIGKICNFQKISKLNQRSQKLGLYLPLQINLPNIEEIEKLYEVQVKSKSFHNS